MHKPVFEIMEWPSTELEWWASFFSIDANKDKPSMTLLANANRPSTVKEEIENMKRVLSL